MNYKDHKDILIIITSIIIAIAPHVVRLPFWIIAWCCFFWGYMALSLKFKLPLPPKYLYLIFAIAGLIGLLITYKHAHTRDASIGLFSVMLGIKPFEIKTHRDRMVTIFLAYFMVISNLFYFETLAMTLYMFLSVLFTTTALINLNHPDSNLEQNFKLSAEIILKAIPIMIVFFILFPRIQGSFWGSQAQQTNKTGFSDYLKLGEISKVIKSREIAFRVEFKTTMPNKSSLYWRGIVLWHFDGEAWRRGPNINETSAPVIGKNEAEYLITLEPTDQKWLFALDLPSFAPLVPNSDFFSDAAIMAKYQIKQRTRYSLKSFTQYNTGNLHDWEIKKLNIYTRRNPKTLALGKKWASDFKSNEEIVKLGLNYFKTNKFSYTLDPPTLSKNVIDDFLFNTRKGFCEHFAASYAFLMRAAGVPSRVVLGYQGGEYNPFGNYLIIRQSDAHAWVEVWLYGKGWIRIDPTAAIAPERIESDEFELGERVKRQGTISDLFKKMGLAWDSVNNRWNQWVMDYTFLEQRKIFSILGITINSWEGILKWIMYIFTMILLFFIPLIIKHIYLKISSIDKVKKSYDKFCYKLSKIGFSRPFDKGPVDFAKAVTKERKDLKEEVDEIINLYILLRYADRSNEDLIRQFRNKVNDFKAHYRS